ncbi:DinB family protein [Alicyclobacillus dauci]|uniref:DinB family protein n=1 Tax=Alicyclobacillus dauci TaxID=1475485 RepID=A0ABY6ZAD3_9BACL|nr:DinB family protein [Alicyclobacillus dauci]WAH39116.1 DinB family protein [Alicyclobacillus dauci]
MFQTVNGFLQSWGYEAEGTQRMLDALTDESLSQEVSPLDRTLGRIAWHVVGTIHEMMSRTGLQFEAPSEDAPVPTCAKEIAETYRRVNKAFVDAVKAQWTDSTLGQLSDMYGEEQPNSFFLMILIRHQIHHRGQMTVLMRQAGLSVPGLYGPSREEWANFGMAVPSI